MCGFCGIINIDRKPVQPSLLNKITDLITHRGPDDEGYLLVNENTSIKSHHFGKDTVPQLQRTLQPLNNNIAANIGFGFRRLAIIDLSEKGHQPMSDNQEAISIVFNGEIYNYLELRQQLKLKGFVFSSATDTEVILKAYLQWGVECVHHFNGMWAFAIWDDRTKRLFCSRDRFGIKPFYYHFHENKHLIIASEIKSLLAILQPSADLFALHEFLARGQNNHTEHTFFSTIKQLRGGHQLILADGKLQHHRYYHLPTCIPPLQASDIIDDFRDTFFNAVKKRLRSDVPVGCALSGGLDSSSIVASACHFQKGHELHTFSVVFPDTPVDESYFVQEVTNHTGVINHSLTPDPETFLAEMERFTWHQEEPNNGSSYLADFLLRKYIKKHNIRVTLEGQGADEIVSGYRPLIHFYLQDLLRNKKFISFLQEAKQLRDITKINLPHIVANVLAVIWPNLYHIVRDQQLNKMSRFITPEFNRLFHKKTVHFPLKDHYTSHLNQKLYQFLFYTSVPPQLVRADKSSMAFSLESRFPFLDYKLVEMAFSLPFTFKIRNGVTKYILREAMKPSIPESVYLRRDKLGFPTPEDKWLRKDLRPWVYDTVYSLDFRSMPFLHWKNFEKQLQNYMDNGGYFGSSLWSLISVKNWQKSFNVSI